MNRSRALLLILFLVVLFFTGLDAVPLFDPDEGRYAEIPREMIASHDFVTPRLNGVLYFEKPPLHYWLVAGSLAVLGRNGYGARFWSAFFGLAGVGLAYALGRSTGGRKVGTYAAVILGTSPLYLALSHLNLIDMTVTFFLSATLTCYWLASRADRGPAGRLLWHGMFAASAFAVLSKGLIGLVIPVAIVFLHLLFAREWRVLARVPWITGVALFLAIALPWHLLVALRNPDFLWVYFVREHVLRFMTTLHDRAEPWWFFLPVLLVGMLPWSGLLPAASALFLSRRPGGLRVHRPELIFLGAWLGSIVVFFSASQAKLIPYVLPGFPAVAILCAHALVAAGEEDGRHRLLARAGVLAGSLASALLGGAFVYASSAPITHFSQPGIVLHALLALGTACVVTGIAALIVCAGRVLTRGVPALALTAACIFGAVWAAGPQIAVWRSSYAFAEYLEGCLGPNDGLFSLGCYPQTLPFYLNRTMGAAAFLGELEFGVTKLPGAERLARFPNGVQFKSIWESDRTIYLLTDRDSIPIMRSGGMTPGRILFERGQYLLMTNR